MLAHEAERAIQTLDLMFDLLDEGRAWIKGSFTDGKGRYCVVGAMRAVQAEHGLNSAEALCTEYLRRAIPTRGRAMFVQEYNDIGPTNFGHIAELILTARKLAEKDFGITPRPAIKRRDRIHRGEKMPQPQTLPELHDWLAARVMQQAGKKRKPNTASQREAIVIELAKAA